MVLMWELIFLKMSLYKVLVATLRPWGLVNLHWEMFFFLVSYANKNLIDMKKVSIDKALCIYILKSFKKCLQCPSKLWQNFSLKHSKKTVLKIKILSTVEGTIPNIKKKSLRTNFAWTLWHINVRNDHILFKCEKPMCPKFFKQTEKIFLFLFFH